MAHVGPVHRIALHPHPATPASAVEAVEVELHAPSAGQLRLRYEVRGTGRLLLPAPADPERADELWKQTCFEVFTREGGAQCYDEFNFSPSTRWGNYRFAAYRSGMTRPEAAPPRVEGGAAGNAYVLHAAFDLPGVGPWRLGLAAVLEEQGGTKSYWALAHPAAAPDFHHADGFALALD